MILIIKSIAIGVAVFAMSSVGIWFVISPFFSQGFAPLGLLLLGVLVLPLFLAGYLTAKFTESNVRGRRVFLGSLAGLIGFALYSWATNSSVDARDPVVWVLLSALPYFGAASVATLGGLAGTRRGNVP